MYYRGGITFMFLLVLVSIQTINCGVLPEFVDRLSIPDIGKQTHSLASSSANAASNAYTGLKSYFTGLRGTLRGNILPIRGVIRQGAGAASNAAAASSAQGATLTNGR